MQEHRTVETDPDGWGITWPPAGSFSWPRSATTTAVCLDVSRRELYTGSPLYDEIVGWMGEQGFRVALDRVSLTYGNLLFVRS